MKTIAFLTFLALSFSGQCQDKVKLYWKDGRSAKYSVNSLGDSTLNTSSGRLRLSMIDKITFYGDSYPNYKDVLVDYGIKVDIQERKSTLVTRIFYPLSALFIGSAIFVMSKDYSDTDISNLESKIDQDRQTARTLTVFGIACSVIAAATDD